jgi:hypothetical protein
MIEKKSFLITLAALIVSILFLIATIFNTKFALREINKENALLTHYGELTQRLKNSWENKDEIQKLASTLSAYPTLIKNESKGNKYLFEFECHTPEELDEITNVILNSTVTIKRFTVKKLEQSKATLLVEFEK